MKLLYATSITLPATFANRHQTVSMARAFNEKLAGNFVLGVVSKAPVQEPFAVLRIPGSIKSPVLAWRYMQVIRTEKITHIFCREARLAFFLQLYARLLRIPLVFCFEAHFFQKGFFFLRVVQAADYVVATTAALARDLEGLGIAQRNILCMPNGIDLARYERLPSKEKTRATFNLPEEAFVVGYTGSIGTHSWKGVDTLLEAARILPQAFLVWVVGGTEEEQVRLSRAYPNVRFEGYVEGKHIPAVQHACDVLVLPNTRSSIESERYTSPLKLFEYMASGVPVVASDLPSVREIVSEREAAFFGAGDTKGLEAAITAVRTEPEAAHVRAARARQVVAQYAWGARAERILETIL